MGEELSILMDRVGPEQIGASLRQRGFLGSEMFSPAHVLFSAAAQWSTHRSAEVFPACGPRHLTLRHRGRAPVYHRPLDPADAVSGTLKMFSDRLVLKPSEPGAKPFEIKAGDFRRVSFYADCIEVIHGIGEETVLCTDAIDQLDLKFEVYYGRQFGLV